MITVASVSLLGSTVANKYLFGTCQQSDDRQPLPGTCGIRLLVNNNTRYSYLENKETSKPKKCSPPQSYVPQTFHLSS